MSSDQSDLMEEKEPGGAQVSGLMIVVDSGEIHRARE